MKKSYCIFLFIFVAMSIRAQDFSRMNVPYSVGNILQNLGFAGGLRSPQFSNIDYNGDGIQDLFVFDRTSSKVFTFIKSPGNNLDYTYQPSYEAYYPKMYNWAILKDYDNDGIEDLFTQSFALPQTIELYRGQKDANGRLTYTLVTFPYGLQTILMVPAGGGYTGIYVSNIDMPAIEDVDKDGDVDILAFEPDGSYVTWYKNLQVEEGLPAITPKFKIEDICWGKFAENGQDDGVALSNDPFSCGAKITTGNGGERHSGSSVSVFDDDRDGDFDIFLGDIGSTTITKLTNDGTAKSAFMTMAERGFPENNISPEINIFLSINFVDINGDKRKDMVLAVNEKDGGQTVDHIWAYVDKATTGPSKFELVTKNFLVEQTAFFYAGSSPAFMDVDKDGLQDIIVGTNGYVGADKKLIQKMMLLRNVGTLSTPAYSLIDSDLFKFSEITTPTGRLSPTVGDLDNDGDDDIVIGDRRGTLYFVKNNKQGNGPNDFAPLVEFYQMISIGNNASPFIIDLDKDGLNDIVITEKNNNINFIKNIGTIGNPKFNPTPSDLPNSSEVGNVFPVNDDNRKNADLAYVTIDDELHLMLSYDSGKMGLYNTITSNVDAPYNLIDGNIGGLFFGNYSKFDIANIDNDPFYELVIGDESGSLRFYNTPYKPSKIMSSTDVGLQSSLVYFPNPTQDQIYIGGDEKDQIRLIDQHGRTIKNMQVQSWNNVDQIVPGSYYLQRICGARRVQYALVIIR